MREVHLVAHESTATSLVFRALDSDEEFFLAVDDSLLDILTSPSITKPIVFTPAGLHPNIIESDPTAHEETGSPAQHNWEYGPILPDKTDTEQGDKASSTDNDNTEQETEPTAPEQPLRASDPLPIRPREIQDRIRGGASIEGLATEIGVPVTRIEPFAHPVLADRANIADQAKRALPVRDDGPAKLTLWEILATAFAARGLNLADSEWDAYRDPAHQWVVRVSWTVGMSTNSAEWSFHRKGATTTVIARDANAADLIDPDFSKPMRPLAPVSPNSDMEDTRDDLPAITDEDLEDEPFPHPAPPPPPPPQPAKGHSKRRRKAVTPGWEDILLGVRPHVKRNRNDKG